MVNPHNPHTPHTTFDPSEIERRRTAAYRQIPALRQQALAEAAAALGALWHTAWRSVSRSLRRPLPRHDRHARLASQPVRVAAR